MNYIKEPPKQCLWFRSFFVFFYHLVFIQPRICTVIESNTRTKMKEERKGEGREKKKRCCYLCYIQSSTEFLHNLWCNPNSAAGWPLSHCFCSTKSASSLFQPFRVFFLGGWLALDLLYYHSFLLSVHSKGLSDLSDPPWMQLSA